LLAGNERDGATAEARACHPSAKAAVAVVNELVKELSIDADVHEVRVESLEEATRLGFLGSPTIRVAGKDVEPGADRRGDYALACRVYRTSAGTAGVPDRAWIQEALSAAGR